MTQVTHGGGGSGGSGGCSMRVMAEAVQAVPPAVGAGFNGKQRPPAPPLNPALRKKGEVQPWMKAVAGSVGGIVEACCLQPVDVMKTRLQLDSTGTYRGMVHCGTTIAREEGIAALWKGLAPFSCHLTLKYTMRMGTNALYTNALRDENGELSLGRRIAAGLGAGVTEAVLVVTPFEVVKVRYGAGADTTRRLGRPFVARTARHRHRLAPVSCACNRGRCAVLSASACACLPPGPPLTQLYVARPPQIRLQQQVGLAKEQLKYKGPLHAARTIVREEGVLALWSGVAPTVCRNGTNQALMFPLKWGCDSLLWGKKDGDGQVLTPGQSMTSGFVAGMAGPFATVAFDVVKTRMMAQDRNNPKYRSMLHALVEIPRQEGLGALFKGLVPRLCRIPPGQAIVWAVADQITQRLAAANGIDH